MGVICRACNGSGYSKENGKNISCPVCGRWGSGRDLVEPKLSKKWKIIGILISAILVIGLIIFLLR